MCQGLFGKGGLIDKYQHMKIKPVISTLSFLLSLFFSSTSFADVITDWNLITVRATKNAGMNNNLSSRIEAIESIAVYDAVNAVDGIGSPYHYNGHPMVKASAVVSAAKAAHDVLTHYFPGQQAGFDSAYTVSIQGISDAGVLKASEETGAAAIIQTGLL